MRIKACISLLTATAVAAVGIGAVFAFKRLSKVSTQYRLSSSNRALLLGLENDALRYFIENQLGNGLILDRQTNSGPLNFDRPASTSATGMGLIAIALASSPEHHIITHAQAVARVKEALTTSLSLYQVHGMMPHFLDPKTLQPVGSDKISTIDSSWLIAGALWSSQYLDDPELKSLANQLYDRVDWSYFAQDPTKGSGSPLIMGIDQNGNRIPAVYDRFNAEVAFMYMLAIGAQNDPLPPQTWQKLAPYYRDVDGIKLASGDLGLFAFQYSNELFDFSTLHVNGQIDLSRQSQEAVQANFLACRNAGRQFNTYDYFWGLSAGDGPPDTNGPDAYRSYSPLSKIDGTATITASLGSVDVSPELVLQNVQAAERGVIPNLRGRYGYSNVNLDRKWVSQDVVGIDLGAAVMALENELFANRTRSVWQQLPMVKRAVSRLESLNGK